MFLNILITFACTNRTESMLHWVLLCHFIWIFSWLLSLEFFNFFFMFLHYLTWRKCPGLLVLVAKNFFFFFFFGNKMKCFDVGNFFFSTLKLSFPVFPHLPLFLHHFFFFFSSSSFLYFPYTPVICVFRCKDEKSGKGIPH